MGDKDILVGKCLVCDRGVVRDWPGTGVFFDITGVLYWSDLIR